jgi:hypothetical protein
MASGEMARQTANPQCPSLTGSKLGHEVRLMPASQKGSGLSVIPVARKWPPTR